MATNTPLKLDFYALTCLEETDEVGADEPYVVFFAADITDSLHPFAKTLVCHAKVFNDMDEGDTEYQSVLLWGLNGKPAPMVNPDNVIILAAVVENNPSSPDVVKSTVQDTLFANLRAYKKAHLDRAAMVTKLINEMHGAIALPADCGITGVTLWLSQLSINHNKRIGKPKELRLTWDDVRKASKGIWVPKRFDVKGDGCHYQLHFGFEKA